LETVAFLLTQLAQGYEKKFGKLDDFTDKCANLSILYYPPNAVAYTLKSNHMAARCQEIQKAGKKTEEYEQKHKKYLEYEQRLEFLGAGTIDGESYVQWVRKMQSRR
jgi:hypothetical protein